MSKFNKNNICILIILKILIIKLIDLNVRLVYNKLKLIKWCFMEGVIEQNKFEKERNSRAKVLIFASVFMYVLMMGSKNVYTAELVVLQGVFSVSRAQVSLAMTYYFITYAVSQLILSLFMGRINLKIYLTVTAGVSAFLTAMLGFAKSIEFMYLICAINGVMQAGIYSGCMAVLNKYVPNKMLPFANKMMTGGTVLYGVISYGTPALFVGSGLWNVPFILLGALFLLSIVFFFLSVQRMKSYSHAYVYDIVNPKISSEKIKPYIEISSQKGKIFYITVMLLISFLGNTVYYCVLNWVPNMLHDVFSMPQEFSILITLLVPLISGVFSIYSISECEKRKNIITVSAIFYFVSLVGIVLLCFFFTSNIVLSIILVAVYLGATSGGRAVFGGVIAFKMNSVVNSGSYLASSNAIAAFVAGIVPTLIGTIIDNGVGVQGYGTSYYITSIISIVNLVFLVAFAIWYNLRAKKGK